MDFRPWLLAFNSKKRIPVLLMKSPMFIMVHEFHGHVVTKLPYVAGKKKKNMTMFMSIHGSHHKH